MIEAINDLTNYITGENILEFIKYTVPLCLVVWTVFYIKKSKFYYVESSSIKLYEDVSNKIQGLSITYKNESINKNLILFNGTIILKSYSDVRREDIDKELTISSADGSAIWKHFEITNSSIDFDPNFKLSGNSVVFEKSLLKMNDYISFAGLLDSKNKELVIGHRITNVVPRSINLKEENYSLYKIWAILFAFPLLLFAYEAYSSRTKNYVLDRNLSKEDSIMYSTYLFRKDYILRGRSLNVDSLKEVTRENQIEIRNQKHLRNQSILDSLSKIHSRSPSVKNENMFLRAAVKSLSTSVGFENPYSDIENRADEILKSQIENKSIDTSKLYQVNDSVSVQFKDALGEVTKSDQDSDKISSFISSLIGYLFLIVFISLSLMNLYKYLLLRNLRRKYLLGKK